MPITIIRHTLEVYNLRFYRMPQPIAREAYDEAMALYARAVAPRTVAVYRVGKLDFPGLSDLDLLVIPSVARADNPQFFSVFDRLPKRLHSLFRHQPTILPPNQLGIIKYTSHHMRDLVSGRDVIAKIVPLETPTEFWCKLLEGYCNQERYLENCFASPRIAAGSAVAMCSSLRYPLLWLDSVSGSSDATPYGRLVDAMRAQFFAGSQTDEKLVSSLWQMHFETMQRMKQRLHALLPLASGQTIYDFTRRVLAGDMRWPQVDCDVIHARYAEIDEYLAEVDRMLFSYGYLFVNVIYSTNGRRYRQTRIHRRLWSLYYRTAALRSTWKR